MSACSPHLSICHAYGLTPSGPAQPVSERVWHQPTQQGDVAIKCYRPGTAAQAEREACLLDHLARHPDPRFRVQTRRRPRVQTTQADRQGLPLALVTDWLPGHHQTYDTLDTPTWAALGRSLAALHLALEQAPPPVHDTLHTRLLALDAAAVRQTFATSLLQAEGRPDATLLRDYVQASLQLLQHSLPPSRNAFPADDPQHPIHNDYNQFNYRFDGRLPPIILDWEASLGAPREYELVRCLNHLPLVAPHKASAFVRAYLAVRPLRIERVAWAVAAASLQHATKTWVVQGWLAQPAQYRAHLAGARELACSLLAGQAQLRDFFTDHLDAGA